MIRCSLRALLFALATLTNIACAHAADAVGSALPDPAATLIRQADTLQLSGQPYWRALLHYRTQTTLGGATLRSGIISPEFFLAADGAENPQAELAATLRAFFLAAGTDPNQHAQCRFVARYQWLRKRLDWQGSEPPAIDCAQFREWSINGRVQSISLVFATGFLSNPASLYGHLLLKFNTPAPIAAGALLDPSMSYGALVPPHENGMVYLYKGLFGGYDAGFSHEKFYRHNHGYAEKELRDLWEYELALSPDETQQVVAHSWELLRIKFRYYFFSENCASAVAELLHMVVDEPLLPDTPWAIPSTVFDKLASIEHAGKPLVAQIRLIPSRQNRFYDKYFALEPAERRMVNEFAVAAQRFDVEPYRQLTAAQKIRVVETLVDYYQFLTASDLDAQRYQPIRRELLAERVRLPAAASQWRAAESPPPPHESQPPFMLEAGAVANSRGAGVELRARPAYYDFLARDTGRAPYSALTMFDLRARIEDNRLRFRSLGLVEIETLNLSRTGLPGDGGNAWKIKAGFEQQNLRCDGCTVLALDGGVGRGHLLAGSTVVYALLEGRVQSSAEDAGTLAATARIGVTLSPSREWRTRLDVGTRAYVNGERSVEPLIRWETRYGASRDWDIGLRYEKYVGQEIAATMAFYW